MSHVCNHTCVCSRRHASTRLTPPSFSYQRRILPKPKRNQRTKQKQLRPRSRTLTSVHDAMLEDLVYPAEIIGKRIRVRLDGSRFIKVHLDKTQQTNIEHKVGGAGSTQGGRGREHTRDAKSGRT